MFFCSPLGFQNRFRLQQRKLKQEQSWKVQTRFIKPDTVPSPKLCIVWSYFLIKAHRQFWEDCLCSPRSGSTYCNISRLWWGEGWGGGKGLVRTRSHRKECLLKVWKFLRLEYVCVVTGLRKQCNVRQLLLTFYK